MLKSILLVFAGAALVLTPMVTAGRGAQQAPAATPAPSQGAATTPAPEMSPAVAPAMQGIAAETKNPVKPTPESQAKAKQIYSIDCALCHGDNGNGKTEVAAGMGLTLADFTNPKSLADRPDGELFNVIRNGTADKKMPNEDAARASDTELWNLVIYVRNLSKAQTAPAQ